MSLINEALKKAQKQRTQDVSSGFPTGTAPMPESAPAPRRVVKRSQPMPAQTLVIVGAACLVIVGVVAVGFWLLIGPSPETTATPAPLVVGSATPSAATTTPSTPVPSGVVAANAGSAAGTPANSTQAATGAPGSAPAGTAVTPMLSHLTAALIA